MNPPFKTILGGFDLSMNPELIRILMHHASIGIVPLIVGIRYNRFQDHQIPEQ